MSRNASTKSPAISAGLNCVMPSYSLTKEVKKNRRNASSYDWYKLGAFTHKNILYIDYSPTYFLSSLQPLCGGELGHAISLNYLRRISLARIAPIYLELGAGLEFLHLKMDEDNSLSYLNFLIPINFSTVIKVNRELSVSPYIGAILCINGWGEHSYMSSKYDSNNHGYEHIETMHIDEGVINGGPQIGLNFEYRNFFLGAGVHAVIGPMGKLRKADGNEINLGINVKIGVNF